MRDWPTAEAEFQRALQFSPADNMLPLFYAAGLAAQHRFDEALEHVRRAEARDPFNRALQTQLLRVLYLARRFDETLRECKRLLTLDRTFRMSFCALARVHTGGIDEGVEELESLVSTSPRLTNLAALGYGYGRAGRIDDALRVAERIGRESEEEGGKAYFTAEVSAGIGDREATLTRLERARQLRYPAAQLRVAVDPKFDLLTADERARLVVP